MPEAAWDRAARARLGQRLAGPRQRLADLARALADRMRLEEVLAVEASLARLGRLADQVAAGGGRYGAWLAAAAGATVPAALAPGEEALAALVEELDRTVRGLEDLVAAEGSSRLMEGLALVDGLVAELDEAWAARGAGLAAEAPPPPAPDRVAGLLPGSRVRVEGRTFEVTARTRWARGDASAALAGELGLLELWQDLDGGLVLFEAQPLAVPATMPAELVVDGTPFRLAWRDAAGGLESGPGGRSRRPGPRGLYQAEEGVRLWVEWRREAVAAARGLALPAPGFQRLAGPGDSPGGPPPRH